MNFARSVEYLLSLGNEVSAMKLGLENIRTLLAALGNPQENYLKVQVAGTNGKGSVCAFLDSICNEAGIRTGTYTSPHLISITERIRINGVDISKDEFARIANLVRETSEALLTDERLEYRPTFFEQMTAIALLAFAEADVKLAILETGLGGRLDATTAANADIVAITRIDLDHQEYLGNTIEEIAAEKAAIIHPGSIVIVADQDARAMEVIFGRCHKFKIEPRLASKISVFKKGKKTSGNERDASLQSFQIAASSAFDIVSDTGKYIDVVPGLRGEHQLENTKVAVLVAEALQDKFDISPQGIVAGLENSRHPGRLEFSERYLFDGAHNLGGALALRAYIEEFVSQPITMIFGAMSGKDIPAMVETLFPLADTLILTKPANSRAMTAEELADQIPISVQPTDFIMTDSVNHAIAEAESRTAANGLILVTGSLYLVGEVKKILGDKSASLI